ncbi:hypothetical protein, partial [Bifidobacterium psychraerophilum]|uniref:hypothetical protein n=1 Tax=Bifidobacterium psychraerophilum TaxID=218140 RepID=UPI0039ED94C1
MVTAKKSAIVNKPAAADATATAPALSDAEREVDTLVSRGLVALNKFERLNQEQVDRIVAKASIAALNQHLVLARLAVEETGRGLVEDKAT